MEKLDLVRVRDLKKYYPLKGGLLTRSQSAVKAVDGVSFTIAQGTTMGLVGESGCGKSTTGRLLLRLGGEKTAGKVWFRDVDLDALSPRQLRALRPKMQIIFQDPFSSLSPRLPVSELISEGVRAHKLLPKQALPDYVDNILDRCGLEPAHKGRYPHEFSGGQRQRISIARALALQPEFIVCDEPVSALDVSVQAQIVNLLQQLQQQEGLTYLFISHDLSVVEHICHSVGVMYLGSLVEFAATQELYRNPLHPYTQALLSAIPIPDPRHQSGRILLRGSLPSPADPPPGCKFHTRCPYAMELCRQETPVYHQVAPGHFCACHLHPPADPDC